MRAFLLRCFFMSALFSELSAMEIAVPEGLAKEVKFWELVFGSYHSGECVLHDPENLDVIYGVRKLPLSAKDRAIDAARDQVAESLSRMASRTKPVSKLDRVVWSQIPRRFRNRAYLSSASGRVRCQLGIADGFQASLKRSQRFLPMIRAEVKRMGLPLDIAYLPHLESGFHPQAHSKVGARGLWQLMPSLAKEHGLRVSRSLDQRLDPKLATRIALRQLQRNYRRVESWPLALTGYNYGINGIVRGIRKHGTTDYMELREKHRSASFGFAAKNFFPSFIAARNLAIRYERQSSSADRS
jgi:membrane-bound lytic murein transglycosylase D